MALFPLYARYLIRLYLKYFFLTLALFLGLVLLISSKEIALFAALSPSYSTLFLFSIYQIPYIFPLALPLSALLSSILTIKTLSSSFELIAFRASGFSLLLLITPLLFIAFWITLIDFYIISEVTTSSRLKIRQMVSKKTSNNPLLLLKRGTSLNLHNYAIDLDLEQTGAKDLKFACILPHEKRLSLLLSPELSFEGEEILAKNVAVISYFPTDKETDPPALCIQHIKEIRSRGESLGIFLKKNRWKEETHALPLKLLILKKKAFLELSRRASLSLFPLSFTWIGLLLFSGFLRGEKYLYKRSAFLIFLILTSLLLYMVGKQMKQTISYLLFSLPHLLLLVSGLYSLKKIERGSL